MKNGLIRLLSIMTLATSLSAFAFSDKDKTSTGSNAVPPCAAASQDPQAAVPDKGQQNNDQEKSRQALIREQEKQWLRDLDYAR